MAVDAVDDVDDVDEMSGEPATPPPPDPAPETAPTLPESLCVLGLLLIAAVTIPVLYGPLLYQMVLALIGH
jgi:hypothetical protein